MKIVTYVKDFKQQKSNYKFKPSQISNQIKDLNEHLKRNLPKGKTRKYTKTLVILNPTIAFEYYYNVPLRSNYSNYKSGIKYSVLNSSQSQSLHLTVIRTSLINNYIIRASTVATEKLSNTRSVQSRNISYPTSRFYIIQLDALYRQTGSLYSKRKEPFSIVKKLIPLSEAAPHAQSTQSKNILSQIFKTLKIHNTQEKKQIKKARAKQEPLLTISFYSVSVIYSRYNKDKSNTSSGLATVIKYPSLTPIYSGAARYRQYYNVKINTSVRSAAGKKLRRNKLEPWQLIRSLNRRIIYYLARLQASIQVRTYDKHEFLFQTPRCCPTPCPGRCGRG